MEKLIKVRENHFRKQNVRMIRVFNKQHLIKRINKNRKKHFEQETPKNSYDKFDSARNSGKY